MYWYILFSFTVIFVAPEELLLLLLIDHFGLSHNCEIKREEAREWEIQFNFNWISLSLNLLREYEREIEIEIERGVIQ